MKSGSTCNSVICFHTGTTQYMPPEFSELKQYDGCQGTVWQMGILLVDMLSPVVPAFKHPRHALRMAPRVLHQLSPGNSLLTNTFISYFVITFPLHNDSVTGNLSSLIQRLYLDIFRFISF